MLTQEKHVLILLPHPDDESFGMSLTIAKYRSMNVPVTYVCWTLGEMGRNFGNPPFATRESLPQIRKKELFKAAEAMNLTDVRLGGLRDKTLEFEDDQVMVDRVLAYIEELQPSIIYSFYPGYAVHPDHEASARAVIRAVKRLPANQRPKLHLVAFSNDAKEKLGEPDIHFHLPEMSQHKLEALRAHASQTALMLDRIEQGLVNDDLEAKQYLENEYFYTYQDSLD